jgi:drug/metabolite transporter (DMT)-like permease
MLHQIAGSDHRATMTRRIRIQHVTARRRLCIGSLAFAMTGALLSTRLLTVGILTIPIFAAAILTSAVARLLLVVARLATATRLGAGMDTAIGLGAFMLVVGQGLTDSVTVAVISAAMPVMGIAIEVLLDGKKITTKLVVGTLLSLAGGLMALGGVTGGTGLGLGALLCFGAVLMFTVGSRLTVTAFPQLTALGRTTITLTGAALATGVAAAVSLLLGAAGPNWAVLGLKEFGALALFSIGGLAISQMLWIASIGSIGIALASLHINATPFYVMLIMFALGGHWSWSQAAAAALVGLGVLVAQGLVPWAAAHRD